MAKLPAMPWFVGDWQRDPGVRSLNYEQRGVWRDLIDYLWDVEERGKFILAGEKMEDDDICGLINSSKLVKQTSKQILTTLKDRGVIKVEEVTGVLYCAKMVRDENLRKIRAEAGKKGGNPLLFKQNGSKAEPKVEAKSNQNIETEYEYVNEVEVLNYLNKKAGKKFAPVDSNLKLIRGRLSEGHTKETCFFVIDNQIAHWLGTEWEIYLRPTTLFQKSKFDGYANAPGKKPSETEEERRKREFLEDSEK